MVSKELRNQQIKEDYINGSTQGELAIKHNLTTPRVGQILKKMGVVKEDRARSPLPKHASFTAVYLTVGAKQAVQAEAGNEDKSVTSWLSDLVQEELKRRNIYVREPEWAILNEIELPPYTAKAPCHEQRELPWPPHWMPEPPS